MTELLRIDDIRWTIDQPEPAPCHVAEPVDLPPVGSNTRADLASWWRWRPATLEGEDTQLGDLLVTALTEAQNYRQVVQAALGALHEQGRRHDRLEEQHSRLRGEYREHRARVMAVTG